MDVLVAILTTGFRESHWTNQEIGVAIGRGVPVISVRLVKILWASLESIRHFRVM